MSKEVKIGIVVAVIVLIAIIAYFVYKQSKGTTKKEGYEDSPSDPVKQSSKAQDILNLGGEVMKDVANSDLLA